MLPNTPTPPGLESNRSNLHQTQGGSVFVAIVDWSGILGFVQELGDKTPELDEAVIALTDGSLVTGGLLGRSTDRIFLVQPAHDRPDHILVIATGDVACFAYGDFVTSANGTGVSSCEVGVASSDNDQAEWLIGGLVDDLVDQVVNLPSILIVPGPDEPARLGQEPAERAVNGTIDGQRAQFQVLETGSQQFVCHPQRQNL
jgi:hypothetical protein